MPQCQFPIFLLFLCFRKATQEIFSELDEMESKAETEGDQGPGAPWGGAAYPWPAPPGGVAPGPPSDATLPPIYSPRRGKPKTRSIFPRNILQAAAVVDTRSGGSRSSSRHPAEEGNHHRRPSSSPYLPPE
jgi:hypothetical protein